MDSAPTVSQIRAYAESNPNSTTARVFRALLAGPEGQALEQYSQRQPDAADAPTAIQPPGPR